MGSLPCYRILQETEEKNPTIAVPSNMKGFSLLEKFAPHNPLKN